MKNTTLRGLFAAALVLVSSSAFAQNDNTATASAVIVAPITIDKTTDLNFGTLAAGFEKNVTTLGVVNNDAIDLLKRATLSGDESAANFNLTKGANVPVILSVTGLALSLTVGTETTALPAVFAVEAISDAANSSAVNFDGDIESSSRSLQIAGGGLGGTQSSQLTSATSFKVRIGGKVAPAADQDPGLYEGVITLTATYN